MTKKRKRKPRVADVQPSDPIEVRRIRMGLGGERRLEMGDEMARLVEEIDKERDEKAAEAKVFSEHIKELEGRLRRLAHDLEEGREDVDLQVSVRRDFEANAVKYVWVETGEVVDERAMTAEEREAMEQRPLEMTVTEGSEVLECSDADIVEGQDGSVNTPGEPGAVGDAT